MATQVQYLIAYMRENKYAVILRGYDDLAASQFSSLRNLHVMCCARGRNVPFPPWRGLTDLLYLRSTQQMTARTVHGACMCVCVSMCVCFIDTKKL